MAKTLADGLALADHLAREPDDWEARLIYADWLEEDGDDSPAKAHRWMASHKRRPVHTTAMTGPPKRTGWVSQLWADRVRSSPPNPTVVHYKVAVLPQEVFDRLKPKYPRESGTIWAAYDTFEEAERALAEALEQGAG